MKGQDDLVKLTQLIATVAHLAAYIPQWLWRIVLWREGYAVRLLHSPSRVHGSVEELTERGRDIVTSRISFASLSEEQEEYLTISMISASRRKKCC